VCLLRAARAGSVQVLLHRIGERGRGETNPLAGSVENGVVALHEHHAANKAKRRVLSDVLHDEVRAVLRAGVQRRGQGQRARGQLERRLAGAEDEVERLEVGVVRCFEVEEARVVVVLCVGRGDEVFERGCQ
jgi:hypothetical protein